jgi:hypothetical protein
MNRRASFLHGICIVFSALALWGFTEGSAHAVTGWISGSVQLWNKNGDYCPTTNSCVGSRYPQSQFNTWQPLSNAFVNIYDAAGNFIGQGGTSNTGTFTATWTASVMPAQIRVRFFPYQKEGRFFFAQTDGLLYNWFTGLITTTASSAASPQSIGASFLGSSAAPDAFANAYWAGEREWRDVFNLVGVLQAGYTNVQIRGFADSIAGYLESCPTSCAFGPSKQVQLDANAGFSPQARVMHEMGHIATYVTHNWMLTGNYNWPNTTGSSGWSQTSAEWGDAGFEEAFATHYGSIAFWGDNAATPTTCLSSATCYTAAGAPFAGTDIEASSFPFATNNCSTVATNPESRWPLSHMRFFWDVFDNHNDADGDAYSANQGDFWKHLHNLAWYPEGTEVNQINEPWNPARTAVTEPDGRGSTSYAANYAANVVNISLLRIDNCSPP